MQGFPDSPNGGAEIKHHLKCASAPSLRPGSPLSSDLGDRRKTARACRATEFKILGPLEIIIDGRTVSLAGRKRSALLLLFLIHANEVMSVDRLVDSLWAERPPPTARASLQNAICKLRRILGVELVETRVPGYILRIAPEQLDSVRFERLRRQAATQAPAQRVRTLEQALSLWRGEPLLDVFYEAFAQPEIRRLDELQIATREDLCAARLDLGSLSDAIAELQALVEIHPDRETLRHQLMFALHRAGRNGDALHVFAQWETHLQYECGTQPSESLLQTATAIFDRRVRQGSGKAGASRLRPLEPTASA